MPRKQKIKSRFPSLTEKHLLGGFNWTGPGTEIYDRIGLNYKGGVGTEQYWLPKNRLDLAAFKHDLAYYSNDNLSRIGADKEFIDTSGKTVSSTIADSVIAAQLAYRITEEFGGILTRPLAMRAAYSALINLLIVPPTKGKESVASFLLKPTTGRAPQVVKDWALKWLGIQGSKRGARGKNIEQKIMAHLFLTGSVLYTDIIPGGSNIESFVKKMEDTYNVNTKNVELNSVFSKYKDYLDTVGEFNLSGEFILTKKKHTTNRPDREYIRFFKGFQKYIDFENKKNKEGPKYPKPVLNIQNLQSTAISDDSPIIVPLETVKEFNLLDFAKTTSAMRTTQPQPQPDAARTEIISVLKGENKVFNLLDFAI